MLLEELAQHVRAAGLTGDVGDALAEKAQDALKRADQLRTLAHAHQT